MTAIFPTYLKNCLARKEVKTEYYKLIEKMSGEENGKKMVRSMVNRKKIREVSLSKKSELLSNENLIKTVYPINLIKLK